jgi:hypothetical protein
MTNLNSKKMDWTLAFIASVTPVIEEDCWLSIEALAAAHGTSISTHAILYEDMGLEKKSAR